MLDPFRQFSVRTLKKVLVWAAVAVALAASSAAGGEVVVGFSAVVNDIQDICGCIPSSAMSVGDTTVGFYVYGSDLQDMNPDSAQGWYEDTQSPHRIVVYHRSYTFASDSADPWLVMIVDNADQEPLVDSFQIHSLNNAVDPIRRTNPLLRIWFAVQDTVASALSSDSLLQGVPNLADWNFTQLLVWGNDWTVVADVVGLEPSPPSAIRDGPTRLGKLTAYPNPFNPAAALSFMLGSRAHTTLEIFDIRGRHVTTLVDRPMTAGPHEIRWDGRNSSGTPVASGVYFARVRTTDQVVTRKLVLVR